MRRRGQDLPRSFYDRDPRVVAPELLGKVIESNVGPDGPVRVRLVEVEAYCGAEDRGSHAFRGPTRRNASMFGPPGHLYVYFTYGMHWCTNVVCNPPGTGHAVLLRAAAFLEGLEILRARRPKAHRDRDLCSGPARLSEALGLTGDADGADLLKGPVRVLDDGTRPPDQPGVSTRVGLRNGVEHRWRWFVDGDPNLSRS